MKNPEATIKERILKQTPNTFRGGYAQVKLCKDGICKNFRVHKLVALAFIDNPENKPEIDHKDMNVTNNTVENLRWCSSYENKKYKRQYKS